MQILRDTGDFAAHPTRGGALVPTMGALHAGHLALIRRAVELRPPGKPVVVSVFVNPTQFGPGEDYTRYPRMLEKDVEAAATAGADLVFAPEVNVMYPPGEIIATPTLPAVATQPRLEDAHRPTHFAGVCQVVARLFDLIQPAIAVFGEKDFQQLRVIESLVVQEGSRWPDLKIIPHPTLREPDGLALSSRNMYLKHDERQRALGLSRALIAARKSRAAHPEWIVSAVEQSLLQVLRAHDLNVDYAVIRDAATLMPLDDFDRPARALIAARLGSVRLIDNGDV